MNATEEASGRTVSPDAVHTVIEQAEMAMEAILFAAGHPVSYGKLAAVIGLSERDVLPGLMPALHARAVRTIDT